MNYSARLVAIEKEGMTPAARALFLKDLSAVCSEYFDCDAPAALDLTRTEDGFSVCVIFQARRVKRVNEVK